ncbi:MAG TPA: HEAT repeat domain-containing protein, partial [Bacteroidota bacterium]|nr:HEAT repeat domain-containing protein [Bacteroidota bacterium]
TLVDLFYTLPKSRKEQTQTIFYAVAEVGNDRAVDFLTKVALSHDDYDLRSDAVYYLGSIGGEKARAALYQILRSK